MKLEYKSIQSATISVSASTEDYKFSANVAYTNGDAQNIYDGFVTRTGDDVQVANFSSYDVTALSINFSSADDKECEIMSEVKEFLEAVRTSKPNYEFVIA